MSVPVKSTAWSRVMAVLRANPLEFLLLAFGSAMIIATMAATTAVTLERGRHDDLTFSGAVSELSKTLKDRGPERVGVVQRASLAVGRDTIVVDTLAITADSATEPSFARGGFLRDQVARFNDHAIRSGVRAAVTGEVAPRGRPETGSVFRLVWTDSGTTRLSDTANAIGLAIRSPYAEDSWRQVRTIDWLHSPSLLGYDGQVALSAFVDSTTYSARLNGRECDVRAEARTRHLVYCTGAVGRAVERFFDVGFTTTSGSTGSAFGAMFPYRPRDVWVDGKLERFVTRHAVPGTLVELRSTGGFLLSGADWGTLAAEQWINGRTTFLNQRVGTLSFFGRAGRSATTNATAAAPLTLSFDARMSVDVERQAREFLAARSGLLRRMVVVLMDAQTGEIRAIAEPHRQSDDEPLLSFEPVLIGSAVKPIVAAAVLSRQPDLGDMRIDSPDTVVASVGKVPLMKAFRSAANGCGGALDFDKFFRCSNNQFAAELVVRSLKKNGYERGEVPRRVLEESDIANGLADVFDVDAYAGRTSGRFASYWTPSDTMLNGSAPIVQDRTLVPWESRPWLVFPKNEATPIDWIARWSFGGWENRWTLVGTAQAYARIVTGRTVRGTFLHADVPRPASPAPFAALSAFEVVRRGLERVATDGTAKGLHAAFQTPNGRPLTVLAKTGTLNEDEATGNTRMKALVFAVGERADSVAAAPLRCGLVAVTYFEFQDDWNKRSGARALPNVHLDFARDRLAPLLTREWRRVSGCESRASSTRQFAQQIPRVK